MPWIPLVVGAAIGMAQAQQKQENEGKDRNAEAIKERYSPWTGQHGERVEHTDVLGTVAGGAAAGAQFGQNAQAAQDQHAFMEKGYSPYTGFGPGAKAMNGPTLSNTGSASTIYGAGLSPDQAVNGYGKKGTFWGDNPYGSSGETAAASPYSATGNYASTYPKGYFGMMSGPYRG